MPHTHTRTFRVRSYECDANGHLNSANYLRFMQETAFDASTAAGYSLERYQQMGQSWLIRESGIEYMLPVVYGDTLSVRSWVADFRKISSRRMYEFSTNGNAGLTAQAYTDWVFIDSNTLQPAAIPAEMETAFFPEGLPVVFPPRQPFPKAPPPPEGAFHMPRMVEWKDIDRMQHVNNAVYLDYANECGAQHVSACGWSWQRMAEHGFAIFLRRVLIKYLQPALLNDQLDIDTWLYDVRRTTAMRVYIIRRSSDGALLVEMHHQGVCVDLASGAPRRFPADFSADLEGSIGS